MNAVQSAPGTLRAAWLLARKDLLLEVRSREVSLAMALFSAATLVLFHFAVSNSPGGIRPAVACGLLWTAALLASLLALARLLAPERDEGLLDALLLAPLDRTAIWLGKAAALLALLVVLDVFLLPLFWLLFLDGERGAPSVATLAALLALADVGLAAVGALVATLASATRSRELLLPLLFLPVATPLVILATTASAAAARGGSTGRYLALIAAYDLLFGVLAWGAFEHVVTE
jgi:heme exporter protein B